RRFKQAFLMMVAFTIYNDGIQTIIKMATVYGTELKIDSGQLIAAILVVQFVGIPCAFLFGMLAGRIGAKTSVYIGLLAYTGICIYGYFIETARDFWILAVAVGLVQGGTQALSRSMFASLVPRHKSGEFWDAGAQPVDVRVARAASQERRVLRLLQRLREVRRHPRAARVLGRGRRVRVEPLRDPLDHRVLRDRRVAARHGRHGRRDGRGARRRRRDAAGAGRMSAALYRLFYHIAAVAMRWYYRTVEFAGTERIPQRGPLLLVVNHPNELIDALCAGLAAKRRLTFTGKATLFTNPLAARFLRTMGVVPLRRAKDEAGVDPAAANPRRNAEAFAALHEALRGGEAALIFPEGISWDTPHLAPLRTGAARIALSARDDAGVRGLRIVPVGINYERKDGVRSRVLVEVGDPLDVDTFAGDVDALTDELSRRLWAVTLNFDDEAAAGEVLDVATVLASVTDTVRPLGDEAPIAAMVATARRADAIRRRIAAGALPPETVERVRRVQRRLVALRRTAGRLGIRLDDVALDTSLPSASRFAVREPARVLGTAQPPPPVRAGPPPRHRRRHEPHRTGDTHDRRRPGARSALLRPADRTRLAPRRRLVGAGVRGLAGAERVVGPRVHGAPPPHAHPRAGVGRLPRRARAAGQAPRRTPRPARRGAHLRRLARTVAHVLTRPTPRPLLEGDRTVHRAHPTNRRGAARPSRGDRGDADAASPSPRLPTLGRAAPRPSMLLDPERQAASGRRASVRRSAAGDDARRDPSATPRRGCRCAGP
ncbi:MAG: MFS transporter, partial [Gemmatimonadaceae bacterium]|nr:MFS transporter [Gemmatimonadaceae bacterium]